MKMQHIGLKKIDHVVYKFMWAVSIISGVCLLITAILCTVDVLLSKFLSMSIPNGTEWVTYLNIPVVFCAIAYIQIDRGHTAVDLISAKFPKVMQKIIKVIGDILGACVCGFAGYCAWTLTADKFYTAAKSSSAANAFVIWPFAAFIVLGFVLVAVAFAWCIVRDIVGMEREGTSPEGIEGLEGAAPEEIEGRGGDKR